MTEMKIGIISEFRQITVNYGNNLQAFALNRYLRDLFPECTVESLSLDAPQKLEYTSLICLIRRAIRKFFRVFLGKDVPKEIIDTELVYGRLEAFREFQETNIVFKSKITWNMLCNSDYDLLIVGSDVVWSQIEGQVNRIKFLDFQNRKSAYKISYAASFGQNVIPKENRKTVRRMLRKFQAISVREKSAVELLNSIGVNNVVHTVDPTLLLPRQVWADLEHIPRELPVGKPYVFAYILGAERDQLALVQQFCSEKKLPIVYVPCASGIRNKNEIQFGGLPVKDCSPEEWIWLIHHAEYVITDSFHGVVFSTIFKKKFLVLKRNYIRDINIRLIDYLSLIDQQDKVIIPGKAIDVDGLIWNYNEINQILDTMIAKSKQFIDDACRDKNKE